MPDNLTPNYVLRVGDGYEVDSGVRELIQSIEYESAEGMADVLHIKAVNPDFVLSESRLFAPGNEVSVWMGYGVNDLRHIGRVRIYKNTPTFPKDGWSMFEATGYTRDHEMMHNSPQESRRSAGRRGSENRSRQQSGRRFHQMRYSEAVEQRARDYGFNFDIDPTPEEPTNFIQKVGLSDYDFIKGLANLTGYYFWVDGDENGFWTIHFRNPLTYDGDQDATYTFVYNDGDMSTLFSFEPEFLVTDAIATIRAQVRNTRTGRLIEVEFTENNLDSPDLDITSGVQNIVDEVIETAPATAAAVQIYIGDYSFEDVANRRFTNESELTSWVRQWYRRQRENFILSNGESIGIESIMARQLHNISGVGTVYDGQYFFSRVAHKMDGDGGGYTLSFSCRKQTPRMP